MLCLQDHFARTGSRPADLADAFHHLYVSIHPDDHVAAVAERADPVVVRETGRWLVRHGTDQCAVTVGMALLAAVGTAEDMPLIQTIGLLSNRFGPLAATALERLPGGVEALLWLADRVAGWGRVYIVEALCRLDDPVARPWLLRKACDGDFLNGYFAGKVAIATRLHEALDELTDPEVVDHTGRLLDVMSYCEGMGHSLNTYAHSSTLLAAHARQTALLPPTPQRVLTVSRLAERLAKKPPASCGCTAAEQQELLTSYRSTLGSWEAVTGS